MTPATLTRAPNPIVAPGQHYCQRSRVLVCAFVLFSAHLLRSVPLSVLMSSFIPFRRLIRPHSYVESPARLAPKTGTSLAAGKQHEKRQKHVPALSVRGPALLLCFCWPSPAYVLLVAVSAFSPLKRTPARLSGVNARVNRRASDESDTSPARLDKTASWCLPGPGIRTRGAKKETLVPAASSVHQHTLASILAFSMTPRANAPASGREKKPKFSKKASSLASLTNAHAKRTMVGWSALFRREVA